MAALWVSESVARSSPKFHSRSTDEQKSQTVIEPCWTASIKLRNAALIGSANAVPLLASMSAKGRERTVA